MDALPIQEATGLDFASREPGKMHACGHDSHSAMLASAARILCARREEIAGRILFMFQPGEEGHHGARIMMEEGLLGDPLPDAAFALHIWPTLPHGAVACRAGAMLASTDTLKARIVGKGGHAGPCRMTRSIRFRFAAEVVLGPAIEVARRTPVTTRSCCRSPAFTPGTTHNVLPDAVERARYLRSFLPEARDRAAARSNVFASHVAAAHGCTAEAEIEPATRQPSMTRERSSWSAISPAMNIGIAGLQHGARISPMCCRKCPVPWPSRRRSGWRRCCHLRAPLHNPGMMIDESVLPKGVALHCAFATRSRKEVGNDRCCVAAGHGRSRAVRRLLSFQPD
jgi:hippurate hydrolase